MQNVDKLSDIRKGAPMPKVSAADKDDPIIIDNDMVVIDDFDFDDPGEKPAPAPAHRGSIDIDTD